MMPWAGIEGGVLSCDLLSHQLIAARDPHGFRPLCMGETADGKTVFASESCALDAVGARFLRDIRPAEIVTVSYDGVKSDTRRCGTAGKHCASLSSFTLHGRTR